MVVVIQFVRCIRSQRLIQTKNKQPMVFEQTTKWFQIVIQASILITFAFRQLHSEVYLCVGCLLDILKNMEQS